MNTQNTNTENEMTKLQIANEWIDWSKANFYHEQYGEAQDYATITDAQWNVFGKMMSYITEKWDNPLPSGSEERQQYRAFATMVTVGPEGTKELIGTVIDNTAHPFAIAHTMCDMIGYSFMFFENNMKINA